MSEDRDLSMAGWLQVAKIHGAGYSDRVCDAKTIGKVTKRCLIISPLHIKIH